MAYPTMTELEKLVYDLERRLDIAEMQLVLLKDELDIKGELLDLIKKDLQENEV